MGRWHQASVGQYSRASCNGPARMELWEAARHRAPRKIAGWGRSKVGGGDGERGTRGARARKRSAAGGTDGTGGSNVSRRRRIGQDGGGLTGGGSPLCSAQTPSEHVGRSGHAVWPSCGWVMKWAWARGVALQGW